MSFLLFIFGLIIGSFINVVSLRFQPGQNPEGEPRSTMIWLRGRRVPYGARLLDSKIIGGRSRCPYCKRQLNWYELIPVLSFIFLAGRCRTCKRRISFQYPLVEILSGLIFLFVPLTLTDPKLRIYPNAPNVFLFLNCTLWVLIFELFLLLSIIDFRHYIIPDSINLSLEILGVFLIVLKSQTTNYKLQTTNSFLGYYSSLFTFTNNIWLNHLIGLIFAAFVFWLIIFLSRGKGMGWGDFKLACALGLIFGWPDILMVFVLSFLLGGLSGIILIILKKKKLKEAVPFGPFLVIGATLVFFFGFQIINWYFKLFSF